MPLLTLRTLGLAAFVLSSAAPAAVAADTAADSHYVAGMGSYVYPDAVRDSAYGAGWQLLYGIPFGFQGLSVELNAYGNLLERETEDNFDFQYGGGLDLRYKLFGSEGFSAYVLAGAGAIYEDIRADRAVSPYANAGLSLRTNVLTPLKNLYWRGDARYYGVYRGNGSKFDDPVNQQTGTLGDARFNFGLELVFDEPAKSLPAPPAAPVVVDADNDGVLDSRDRCPRTPANAPIDGFGCPLPQDGDGDGIVDENDKCPGTQAGLAVDFTGCAVELALAPPPDADGDGVLDLTDECPGTQAAAQVDARGCPLPRDLDSDGVLNDSDLCPDTPTGLRVDVTGCVIKQTVAFNNINFDSGKDTLTDSSKRVLDDIAEGLKGQPTLEVEIGGHTDSQGDQTFNLNLSQKRAAAVRVYLVERGIASSRLRAEGYGEFNPVADNMNMAGRAKNRRVEFKITKQ